MYDHWYFQGLLAETGKRLHADTWVPSQDKNRAFLDGVLGDTRTLESIPEFGYENLVRRASTVDVIWFNERRMPSSFIEVEFSTDFQNSLHKFLDLRDYHSKFLIAAAETRERQFEKRLGQSGFEPIRDRVGFVGFEAVARFYSATEEAGNLSGRFTL